MRYVAPDINRKSFNCPRCNALADQKWYYVLVNDTGITIPRICDKESYEKIQKERELSKLPSEERKIHEQVLNDLKRLAQGEVFINRENDTEYGCQRIYNLNVSRCFSCGEISVWLHDKLLFPRIQEAPQPNPDMPSEVMSDYIEASSILNDSPRGASALLRLAIQKICISLGKPGRNLNEDIGSLVRDGLDQRVQKALDIVRVIGNNSVHPGQIDMKDNRQTAISLFGLVNLIVERMITEPRRVDEIYATLPEAAVKQIEARDRGRET